MISFKECLREFQHGRPFKDHLNEMKSLLFIPFLLGNSASPGAALISLLGYMIVILVGVVMISWWLIKWFK